MTERDIKSLSKFISLILRHRPETIGITLDKNGWADVDALLIGVNNNRCETITLENIKEVVANNDKQRFSFNDDYAKIRANQGHSVSVDVELKEIEPPAVLYHGTAHKSLHSIMKDGLRPGNRLHVHLSTDEETARNVGRRHGKPEVLIIDSVKMYNDGFKFYLSANNVWLTKNVPVEYIKCDQQ